MARTRSKHSQMPIPESNELKYRTIRRGMRYGLILDEVWEQQLKTHLLPPYRNKGETEATMLLTGYLETLNKAKVWTANKQDMMKWFKMSEKLRWDKGFSLTKAEATANFFSVLSSGRPHKIRTGTRPNDLARRRQYPYYKPRMGSSAGKIRTKQIGARRVQKDFENLMKQIFMIGEGLRGKGQKKAKMPKVNVTKYISSD